MRIGHPEENETIWDYQGRDNFIVIPITGFVRKDKALTFIHPVAKQAEEKFPKLAAKWGYLVSSGIYAPIHRTKYLNLLGLKDRQHYAAAPDESTISASLMFLNELSWDNPRYVFYLDGFLGGDEFIELHKRYLTSDKVVVLLSSASHEPVLE
jgi:hypothetical protein